MNKLGLCIFSSTKGHFDQQDIYLQTLKDLDRQYPIRANFRNSLAHIKAGPEKGEFAMGSKFTEYGIMPVITPGNFKHFHQSHADEYTKDICKMARFIDTPYVLLLEDDWVFRGANLEQYFQEAVQILETEEKIVCMRFPHELYDADIFKSSETIYEPLNRKIHLSNYFYSLNPNIIRTSTLQRACELIETLGPKLSPLIEWKFTQAFNILSNGTSFFGAFDPKEIRARHIGLADWPNVLKNIDNEQT